MAASSKQGTYLGTTLTGFTALVAGLVASSTRASLGYVVAAAGVALLIISTAGFARLKHQEVGK